jgi:mono/diheme cytochrome c family protein
MATTSGCSAWTASSDLPQLLGRGIEVRRAGSSVRFSRTATVVAVTVLALVGGVASGCGGGDDAASTVPATTTTAPETGASQAASGAQLFSDNCESCHGAEGAGGHVGPDLQKSSVAENLAQVEEQVRNGGGGMPPFADVLSDEEIDIVARYVVEQIAPKQ